MEEANDLLQVVEQIEKGVINNTIPANRVILILAYTLGTFRLTVKNVFYKSDIDLVSALLKEIRQSVTDGLINYDTILPLLKSFNDSFPLGQNLIDCDAYPFIPVDWKVEEHRKGGLINFDPTKNYLYLSEKQKESAITSNDLRKELSDKPVMNANVLDYLLVHPELIPDEWKGKNVFFWGTIYRYSNGRLFVRYLYWSGSEWRWLCGWLGGGFGSSDPAALAS